MPHSLLFVYGTLKEGGRLHENYLGRMNSGVPEATKVAEGHLDGYDMYLLTGCNIPLIVPGKGQVYGEVYTVDEACLMRIDLMEGGYLREEVEFHSASDRGGSQTYRVGAYIWSGAVPRGAKFIESGKFSVQA